MSQISIIDMLRGDQSSPFRVDSRLEQVGKFLGVPDYWDFGIEDDFSCLMGYGDFTITLWSQGKRVEVRKIGVTLWNAPQGRPQPKTTPIRISRKVKVVSGGIKPGLGLSDAKSFLRLNEIFYKEIDNDDASEVVKLLVLKNKAKLLFFAIDDEPKLAEIHLSSTRRGA